MHQTRLFSSALRTPAVLLALVIFASNLSAAEWKEKVLYSFQGYPDGATPVGGVVFDKQGNLYGAAGGGSNTCPSAGDCGVVYELSPPKQQGVPWTESVLYTFKGHNYGDGATPEGGVILDAAGNLYGTTAYGGAGPCVLLGTAMGCGTVYELSPPAKQGDPWTETVLYSFQGGNDGDFPIGNLTFDGSGNLYGATNFGGGYGSCDSPYYQHCGMIFRMRPPRKKGGKWNETVIYSFKGGADGANPNGGLIFGRRSGIYGTTSAGGNQICRGGGYVGCGTVFELSPPAAKNATWTEKVLHRFVAGNDGHYPYSGLTQDISGAVYGTTLGDGTIFKLAPPTKYEGKWSKTLLYNYNGCGTKDGCNPGALALDRAGNLYAGAEVGAYEAGLIFRLNRAVGAGRWRYTVLYTFRGSPDGRGPGNPLRSDGLGNFYSATGSGGAGQCQGGCGTVFEVSP